MTDRIAIPLPDGRWLALDRETFDAAVQAGADLAPQPAPPYSASRPCLLTSQQLAEQLSIPATWFEEAARRDEIPSVRVGKYLRFDSCEVLSSLNPRIANARLTRNTVVRRGQK